jgi:hypothetical protein
MNPRPQLGLRVGQDCHLNYPVNWRAVWLLGILGSLHLFIAFTAFAEGRWEAYLSIFFGFAFSLAALLVALLRRQLAILPSQGCLEIRSRITRSRRVIDFSQVHSVNLLPILNGSAEDWHIEIACETDDIPCPPSPIPRQQALWLALTMDVELIKVMPDSAQPDHPDSPN